MEFGIAYRLRRLALKTLENVDFDKSEGRELVVLEAIRDMILGRHAQTP